MDIEGPRAVSTESLSLCDSSIQACPSSCIQSMSIPIRGRWPRRSIICWVSRISGWWTVSLSAWVWRVRSGNLEMKTNVLRHTEAQYTVVAYKPGHCNCTPILRRGERETHSSHLSIAMIRSCQFEESRLPLLVGCTFLRQTTGQATHSCTGKNFQVPCVCPLGNSFLDTRLRDYPWS